MAEAARGHDHGGVRPAAPLLAALLVACGSASGLPGTSVAAPASPRTPPGVVPVPSQTGSPIPQPTSRPGIRATAAGPLPASLRYVALDSPIADGFHTRLWLVDLAGSRPPIVVAEWDAPASPVGGYSASADGAGVIVSAAGTRSRVALYLLRPETGETRILFEEAGTIAISPRISPDGQRVAFTKYPAAGGSDAGIWAGPTGGELRRIADPSTASNVPAMPLAWSADSAWLAFTRDVSLDRTEVHIAPRGGGTEVTVGEGDRVSWRTRAPELLVAAATTPPSRAYTYDLSTGTTTDVLTVAKLVIPVIGWHPTLDRFMYVESEGAGREASGGAWVRSADGSSAQRLDVGRAAFAPEWSRDGSLLTALGGGDDAIVPLIDLLSGRRISVLCRRGGKPPGDCL